jgi:predicted TIM-barrel fold metal-dependent hydrolase
MSTQRYRSISADSHVVEPAELFEPLQQQFGERAPRVVFSEQSGHQLSLGNGVLGLPIGGFLIGGMDIGSPETRAQSRRGYAIARKGVYDVKERLVDQARDGVAAEVIYPSVIFNVYQIDDTNIVEAAFQAYNNWLADYMSAAPDRLYGLGCVQLRDLDMAIREMQRVKDMGFVGLCIPATAPPDLPYSDPYYDRFWAAAQEADMPLTMHIFTGATPNHGMPKWPGVNYPLAYLGIEVNLATILLSGVCERFPRLKFVPTEFETGWVGNFLRRLDAYLVRVGSVTSFFPQAKLTMAPSDYWHRNFLVTFEDDPIGIRTRDFIGTPNLMWGSDYPHGDSIFPNSQRILNEIFEGVPDAERYAITAGNVIDLYHLPFTRADLERAAEAEPVLA